MRRLVRILLPLGLIGLGAWFFAGSYRAYALWQITLSLNDPSGAEFYELDFQLHTVPAVALSGLGMLLVGRWWGR